MRHGPHGSAMIHHRAFAIGVALNMAFVVLEAVFGFLGGSLALVADAGHNLSDVLGLLLAWGAIRLAQVAPTERRTYGVRRSTIFAALLNALLLLVAVGAIALEAVRRLWVPEPVAGVTVIFVAAAGVAVNTGTALLFRRGRKRDLNIAGAFAHMAADAAVSAGVALAGVAILLTGLPWLDPAVSLAIVVVIVVGTWGLLRDSVNLALDAVPSSIDPRQVEEYLLGLPSVVAVHDLHIWATSTTEVALTAHLVKPEPAGDDELIARVTEELATRFGIQHPTIQWERNSHTFPCGDPCQEAPAARPAGADRFTVER
jgi:cobalt-zinc-cadmium efflux system protein